MASKKHRPEEALAKLRQVDVLVSQGQTVAEAIGVTAGFTHEIVPVDQSPPEGRVLARKRVIV